MERLLDCTGEIKLRNNFFKLETRKRIQSPYRPFCWRLIILSSETALAAAALGPIKVVWSRMSGIAQSLSPRAAVQIHSLRTSIPWQRQCMIRRAPQRTSYATEDNILGHAACCFRVRRKPWVTTSGQRVGP